MLGDLGLGKQAYCGDVLYYRTMLNNMNGFMNAQKALAVRLAELIRERYALD